MPGSLVEKKTNCLNRFDDEVPRLHASYSWGILTVWSHKVEKSVSWLKTCFRNIRGIHTSYSNVRKKRSSYLHGRKNIFVPQQKGQGHCSFCFGHCFHLAVFSGLLHYRMSSHWRFQKQYLVGRQPVEQDNLPFPSKCWDFCLTFHIDWSSQLRWAIIT